MPPGDWKPLSTMVGMNGRAFSWRTFTSAAATSACREAISGRLVKGDRHQLIERPGRVDQGDLEVIVLQRFDHGAGVEPEDLA